MRDTPSPRPAPRPRAERDFERARSAAAAARATTNGSVTRPALAAIEAAFDQAAVVNDLKIAVERHIQRGPEHAAVRVRFAARAALLRGCNLEAAIVAIERWRRDEQRVFAIASAFGRGSRLPLAVLEELRLLLRWLRFKRMHAHYTAAFASLNGAPMLEAAE
jgi:pyruvate-formate lyase-activating enzyme